MAATKKSAKRSAGKKSKKASRKASSNRRGGKSSAKSTTLKRQPRKPRAARGGLETVRQVGGKTWETLKTTTAQVVEGVKETFGG